MSLKQFGFSGQLAAGTRMNTTLLSTPVSLFNSTGVSIQVFFTGTPTGSFTLQGSNDPAAQAISFGQPLSLLSAVTLPTHWSTLANSSQAVSAAGSVIWDYDQPNFNWIRVVYTDGSSGVSTATITVMLGNAKGF